MQPTSPQVPWTDEQWARARQVIAEEANRARVAATFLPLYGPLPADADYVARDALRVEALDGQPPRMIVDDRTTIPLATLQVKVYLRGAQVADPTMASALQLFRRAANVLARVEDAVVFRGMFGPGDAPEEIRPLPPIWQAFGGAPSCGLLDAAPSEERGPGDARAPGAGEELVGAVSRSIGQLEAQGHLGPFAVVLGQDYFSAVQTPSPGSLVLPQDRIIPFLGGGWLLRSSTLPADAGVVVATGGAPVELVVATDVTLAFLQVTTDPLYVFRVFEKIVLRIKEREAIVALGARPEPRRDCV